LAVAVVDSGAAVACGCGEEHATVMSATIGRHERKTMRFGMSGFSLRSFEARWLEALELQGCVSWIEGSQERALKRGFAVSPGAFRRCSAGRAELRAQE
jgi:hypothetical protein